MITRHIKTACVAAVLICGNMGQSALALTVSPTISDGRLSVTVGDINYPKTALDKALKSGLPNNIGLWLTLTRDDKEVHVAHLNHQITYDLWDEVYQVQTTSTTGVQSSQMVSSQTQLLSQLSSIALGNVVPVAVLQPRGQYRLKAQVIVNPVQVERIKKIQAWIASSQGYDKPSAHQLGASGLGQGLQTRAEHSVATTGVSSAGPRFQKLFDQILAQYMSSEKMPALWHSKAVTAELITNQH
ncbi:MAG: DUF4390 domain-containing protein [Psychrosphaera sp.]|nr:DUF4390 domain-containing protein [Psychrosphaera sp.]